MAYRRTTGIHHVAYACADVKATTHFYEELMGFPLIHTELTEFPGGYFRHIFFDTGDGAIAFFDLHGAGEKPDFVTNLSESTGTPLWVNHIAFGADEAKIAAALERFEAAGIKPAMDIDHGWCRSVYFVDPNGIMVEFCHDTPGFEPDPTEAHRLINVEPTISEPA